MLFGNQYEKIEELGHGGTGYVFKVRRGSDYFAIKACTSFDQEYRKRFDREIRIAQRINHPNVIQVFDFDLTGTNPFFVMELCDGSIERLISGKSFDELLAIALQICEGIKVLHDNRILHRDIKPANILIKDGIVKVSDFGYGFFLDHDSTTITSTNQTIGTAGYIAPEVFTVGGHEASVLSDIYSLGCTLGFIFSNGLHPQFCKPLDLPPKIAPIINRCTENIPSCRYSTVDEVIADLKALQTPIPFLGMQDIINQESKLDKTSFQENAFRLLMENKRWDELMRDLRLLKTSRLKEILSTIHDSDNTLLHLLEDVYYNDTESLKQFDDAETFAELCALIFSRTTNTLSRQKAIEMSMEIAIELNRFPAMKIVLNKMLTLMDDVELRESSGFLKSKKELLLSIEAALGTNLPRNVRMAAGIA